jgi:hypothetical protein
MLKMDNLRRCMQIKPKYSAFVLIHALLLSPTNSSSQEISESQVQGALSGIEYYGSSKYRFRLSLADQEPSPLYTKTISGYPLDIRLNYLSGVIILNKDGAPRNFSPDILFTFINFGLLFTSKPSDSWLWPALAIVNGEVGYHWGIFRFYFGNQLHPFFSRGITHESSIGIGIGKTNRLRVKMYGFGDDLWRGEKQFGIAIGLDHLY